MGDLVVNLLVAVVAIGAILKVRGQMSGAPVIRRQLTQAEEATVAAAEPGTLVRLTGVIQPVGEARISEISNRPFVARDLRITTRESDGGHPTRPARQSFDFLLDDGTGVALVRAKGAAVSIDRDAEMPQTTLDQVMWLDPLLRASGYHTASPHSCRVWVTEGVVGPGDRVTVAGMVASDNSEADALGAKITITGSDQPVVIVTPDDGESPSSM